MSKKFNACAIQRSRWGDLPRAGSGRSGAGKEVWLGFSE